MATPIDFPERTHYVTPAGGQRYPIWVRDSKLGQADVIESISLWQLSPQELLEVNETGIVFIRIVGGQPPVQIFDADPVDFEGKSVDYTHKDCRPLPTYRRRIVHNGIETFDVTSAWQLNVNGRRELTRNGGRVVLCVVGGQPTVEVFGHISKLEL